MKKSIFLILLVLSSTMVLAKKNYDFMVDGIYYRIIDKSNSVLVCSDVFTDFGSTKISSSYEGDIVIPSTVVYKKKTYTIVQVGGDWRDKGMFRKVTSIKLPGSVRNLSNLSISKITSLELPNSLDSLDSSFPATLSHVVIPANVKYIVSSIFVGGCRDIEISPSNPYYTYSNYALCKQTGYGKEFVAYNPNNTLRTYKIDSDITKICKNAFLENNKVTELIIPKTVRSIEEDAFRDKFWKALTKIVFEGNTYVDKGAFNYSVSSPYFQGTIQMPNDMNNSFITYRANASAPSAPYDHNNRMSKANVRYISEIDIITEKANKGDISAMLALSKKYEKGDGVSKNPREAALWLEKAATAGDIESMLAIAKKYRYGDGMAVLQNTGMAIKWYEQAASASKNPETARTVAWMYQSIKNYTSAYSWFLTADDWGDNASSFYLGLYNQSGYGKQKDFESAVRWYKKTLKQKSENIPVSTYWNMGLIYEYGGYGVEKDPALALTYYHQAADNYSEAEDIKKAQDKCDKLYAQGYREKITLPAMLAIVDGSLRFEDANGNRAIDANETSYLRFKVINKGKGNGLNCKTKVKITGANKSISVKEIDLNTIRPNEQREISIPITAGLDVSDGEVMISAQVDEEGGFGTQPIELTVVTRAYSAPLLQVVDYAASSEYGSISKGRPFALQVLLQNTKSGKAEDVEVKVSVPIGVFVTSENTNLHFSKFDGGKAEALNYEMIASNNYNASTIPVKITIKEKFGRFAESKTINLEVNKSVASNKISLTPAAEEKTSDANIVIASIGSAVDKNIPQTSQKNENTFVVIIANENYQSVAKVPYAINDGRVFGEYCEKTLGVPARNIEIVTDATLNVMRKQLSWLAQVAKSYDGQARLIFYYAGHGIPDEASKSAYLLPIDGYGTDIQTGYKLDDIYSLLGNSNASAVTVFLDACFSGTKREGDMLASARGVAVKAKPGVPKGKMVVFSAATGDETAYPNNDERHGMFTYFLLKKLQETKGDVTYEELGEYIKTNVSRQSIVINKKSQTPTITAAPDVTDWQNWKMK